MRHIFRASILTAVLLWPSAAELNSNDRAVIKEMTRGELHLRNNRPCRYTSGGFGVGAVVVTEVSPTGVDWDKNLQTIHEQQQAKGKKRWSGVDTVFWGFGPNDVIRYAKLYFKDNGVVELWAEGVKPKNVEVWVRFVGIQQSPRYGKFVRSDRLIEISSTCASVLASSRTRTSRMAVMVSRSAAMAASAILCRNAS